MRARPFLVRERTMPKPVEDLWMGLWVLGGILLVGILAGGLAMAATGLVR